MLNSLFVFDGIAKLMLILIFMVSTIVLKFSANYLKGEPKYFSTILSLLILAITTSLTVISNHFVCFWAFFSLSNFVLSKLIAMSYLAGANSSSIDAQKVFFKVSVLLATALVILFFSTNVYHISELTSIGYNFLPSLQILALIILLLAASLQSALLPFSQWLINSANTVTPVSAIMHAGLVSAGGFLLIRFSPLYHKSNLLLNLICILGVFSAVVATFWKLIQSDVKRMLICSTIAQMGFMFVQCGLGLFAGALIHIFLHGVFKTNLFLSIGSREKKTTIRSKMIYDKGCIFTASLAFILSIILFSQVGSLQIQSSSIVVLVVSAIFSSEVALFLYKNLNRYKIFLIIFAVAAINFYYAIVVRKLELWFQLSSISKSYTINLIHISVALILFTSWVFLKYIQNYGFPKALNKVYVKAINASLPSMNSMSLSKTRM